MFFPPQSWRVLLQEGDQKQTLSDKRDLFLLLSQKPIFHLFVCFDEGPNAVFCTSDHIYQSELIRKYTSGQ